MDLKCYLKVRAGMPVRCSLKQCAQVSHPQTICLQIHVNVKNAWALPDFRERQVVSDRESLESLE